MRSSILSLFFVGLCAAAACAQSDSYFSETPAAPSSESTSPSDAASMDMPAPAAAPIDERKSEVQNAVLEGVQLATEPGATADEKLINCYFIFRDKPTNYFYSFNQKEKKLVFEFNDVEMGSSPVQSAKEIPIQGFRVENEKVDANKDVQGLLPEWHDIMKVTFFLDNLPIISVKDEYSVISFSFKWSSDPAKLAQYIQKDESGKKRGIIIGFVGGGVAAAGAAIAAAVLGGSDPTPEGPLSDSDLPQRPDPHQ